MEKTTGKKANVTPQQQQMYDRVMVMARGIIFGDPKKPEIDPLKMILDRLAGGKESMGQEIGETAGNIMATLRNGFAKKGRKVPPEILFHATREVIADLVEIAVSAKLMPEADRAKVTKEALMKGVEQFKQHAMREAQLPAQGPQGQGQPPPQGAAPPAAPQPAGIINSARRA